VVVDPFTIRGMHFQVSSVQNPLASLYQPLSLKMIS